MVDGVCVVEGGVGCAASDDGVAVVFASGDLGVEAVVEFLGEFGVVADVECDFVFVGEPVEVAPDFAAVDFFGSGVGWDASDGFDGGEEDGDVGAVFVGGVVGVEDVGLCL